MKLDIPVSKSVLLRRLSADDETAVQQLCENCGDYFLLHEGALPRKTAAAEIFEELPPGKTQRDKFVFGVESQEGLNGVVDLVRDYPQCGTWMLGLMLLDPSVRGKGMGSAVHRALARWAAEQGAEFLRIGVVEENAVGLHFWSSLGYRTQKEVPLQCGKKTHRTFVMALPVLKSDNELK